MASFLVVVVPIGEVAKEWRVPGVKRTNSSSIRCLPRRASARETEKAGSVRAGEARVRVSHGSVRSVAHTARSTPFESGRHFTGVSPELLGHSDVGQAALKYTFPHVGGHRHTGVLEGGPGLTRVRENGCLLSALSAEDESFLSHIRFIGQMESHVRGRL